MSTRCNIIIKDKHDKLIFYRHSDGYPDGAMPLLKKFMDNVKSGAIRDNVEQAAGWLIYLGAKEYGLHEPSNNDDGFNIWKVGAIEPSICVHGDIEYLYELDLENKTISCLNITEHEKENKFYEQREKIRGVS